MTDAAQGKFVRRPGLLVAFAAAVTALVLQVAFSALTPQPARIQVDMLVSAGTRTELYVNDQTRPPITQGVTPGVRKVYVFDGIFEDVARIRLDPTDVSGATVEVYSVSVVGTEGVLAQFGPSALLGWFADGLERVVVTDTMLGLRSTTSDPILVTAAAIPIGRQATWWSRWVPRLDDPGVLWRLAAAALVIQLLVAMVDPRRRLHLPIAVLVSGLAAVVTLIAGHLPDGPGSAMVAVSRATFVGVSTRPIILGSTALLAGAVLIGAIPALQRKRLFQVQGDGQTVDRSARWPIFAGVAVLSLLVAPDLSSLANATSLPPLVPHWDSDNITYWAYLTHSGELPYKTFWYAYSGMFMFDLRLPVGPGVRWAYEAMLFGTFFVAIARLQGAVPAMLATLLLMLGHRLGLLPGLERYLLPFNVVLTYATIPCGGRSSSRVPFWIACAATILIETPQLVYAAIPVGAIAAFDALQDWKGGRSRPGAILRRVAADVEVPFALGVIVSSVLVLTGQVSGVVSYFSGLGDVVAYSAWPEGLPTLEASTIFREFVPFAAAGILIAVGVYERLRAQSERVYGNAVAGVGLVLLVVLQKNYVRTMGDQVLLPLIAGIAVLGLGWRGRRWRAEYVVAGVLLGTLTVTVALKPATPAVTRAMSLAWKRALVDVTLLASGTAAFQRPNEARFRSDRFAAYQAEHDFMARLRAHAGPQGDERLFSLTDHPILYILSGQPPVWMSNMYNASPIYEQMRVVRWLREEQPPWVALDPDRLTFDSFQMAVRVPLIVSEVVQRYVVLDSAGRISLLRRRTDSEPLGFAYWRERLGADVNVGRLASVASFAPDDSCRGACGDLLEIELPGGGAGATSIPVTIGDLGFTLTFTRVPDETMYRVLLDRVWFWNAAKAAGVPRAVGSPPRGTRMRVRPTAAPDDALY